MKKLLLALAIGVMPLMTFAQEQVTIKAGAIVSLQAVSSVKAADVSEGSTVDFQVIEDVKVDDVCDPSGHLGQRP